MYNMKGFLSQCVDKYCELAKVRRETLKRCDTPFLDESKLDQEWAQQEINKAKTKGGATNDQQSLQPIATKVLMKILYAARLARFDLLRAIGMLSTMITKWDSFCDQKLQ